MVELFRCLSSSPACFWFLALASTAIWAWATLSDRRGWWWSAASLLLLVAWRWPYMLGPATLNPDEAQIIAGAITLKSFPVYWKYVDGTTHGPLTNLPLLLASYAGFPLNYATARLLSGGLMIGGFLLAGRGFQTVFQATAVRLGLAPVILLWATISYYDFTGYTSEQPALFLMLAACWPLMASLAGRELTVWQRSWRLALGGLLLGAVPMAKLQGIPPAAAIGVIALIVIARCRSFEPKVKLRLIIAFASGALTPVLLTGVYLWIWGLGHQFWAAYIASNLMYVHMTPYSWGQTLRDFWPYLNSAPGLRIVVWLIAGSLLAALCTALAWCHRPPWLVQRRKKFRLRLKAIRIRRINQNWRWLLVFAAVALSCLYATLGPRRPAGHYLQFLSLPLALGGVLAWAQLVLRLRSRRPLWQVATGTGFLAVAGILVVVARVERADPEMLGAWAGTGGEWRFPASRAIAELARPGDTMAVWGWMPYFYVETGLPQATREAHTQRQIEYSDMFLFYRQRYLHDFARSKPRLFVDAVGGHNFGYGVDQSYWRDCCHEAFAELQPIIARDYEFVREVEGTRIYLRKTAP